MADLTVQRLSNGVALYRTIDGDVLDELCSRYYGREWDTTETVLEANRDLAAKGPVYPAGLIIRFPVIAAQTSVNRDTFNLWD